MWHSIREIAEKTKVGESTIRRYIDAFPSFFQVKQMGRNRIKVHEEGIKMVLKVARLYDQGMTRDQVEESLQKQEIMTLVVTEEEKVTLTLADHFKDISYFLKGINIQNQQLHEENKQLKEQLLEIKQEIRELRSGMKESKKKWWRFWKEMN